MKNAAIFKIIIWSIVAVFLLGIFITMIVMDDFLGNNRFSFYWPWGAGNVEVVREEEFSVDEIDSIDLKINSGTVYILPTDGDKIIVTEKAGGNFREEELLRISEKDGTLIMEQESMQRRFFFFNLRRSIIHEIRLPEKDYHKIRTRMTSGRIEMNNLEFETVDVKMTSGNIKFEGIKSENVNIELTSGKAHLQGSFDHINALLTSGSVTIDSEIAPSSIRANLTSGKVSVTIPDNDGFIVGVNKTSGSFKTDFEVDDFNRYGNAERQYSIRIISGKAELLKKK